MLPEAFDGVLLAVPSPPQAVAAAATLSPALAALGAGGVDAPGLLGADGALRCPLAVDFGMTRLVNHGPLRWIARDRPSRGRDGLETWSLHASAEWSEAHPGDTPTPSPSR